MSREKGDDVAGSLPLFAGLKFSIPCPRLRSQPRSTLALRSLLRCCHFAIGRGALLQRHLLRPFGRAASQLHFTRVGRAARILAFYSPLGRLLQADFSLLLRAHYSPVDQCSNPGGSNVCISPVLLGFFSRGHVLRGLRADVNFA